MNIRNDYKGIFYEDNSERKYYEGGAHFSYEALYQILKNIKKQQSLNENKLLSREKETIKQAPLVSRQKNFSMKNIFSCDEQMKKNKIRKKNSGNNINNINNEINNLNNNNNNESDIKKDINLKKLNFIRNNVSKEKSLSKKKNKNSNMNQSNSVIHLNSGQCLNININNNFNNFININPNDNNINSKIILNNNNNSNPLRFLKELIDDNKSGKKRPQSRNSKSKGRNYKKKNNANSSIELNNEYNYNYYLVEAGLDKSSKISGNKHSGKSTGAQPSNSVHNLSINAINGLNLTKYSQNNNVGFFNLSCIDNSVNNSKIINKKGSKNNNNNNNRNNKNEKDNQVNINNKNLIHLENKNNNNNHKEKEYHNIENKNKGALSLDKNINKMKFNSFINKNIQINNFVNNKENKQNAHGPIILNENNIKKLKNFNMTIFNASSNKNKNTSIKEKKINFNLSNNKKINNNINHIHPEINKNKNINKNIFNNNRNFLKFSNQSLLKSICLQKQNSRNFFNDTAKNKNQNNMPKKLSEKSCNAKEMLIEKPNNISRNTKINYDKLIKSFEI